MHIIWGTQRVRRKLGFVADYCAACDALRAFRLDRVVDAEHIFFISPGAGELVGFERCCLTCRTRAAADPKIYAAVAHDPDLPLGALKLKTFPNYERVREQARRDTMPGARAENDYPESRAERILASLLKQAPKVEQRFASTHIDWQTALAGLAAIGLNVVTPAAALAWMPKTMPWIWIVALVAAAALVVWQALQSKQRFLARKVLPEIANELQSTNPTVLELTTALSKASTLGYRIGKVLSAERIKSALGARP
jgi:hypothetical protein